MAERINLDSMVSTFKNAWKEADDQNLGGRRTETALGAVLDQLLLVDGDVVIGSPAAYQGVTLWVGDGMPLQIDDDVSPDDLRDWIQSPVQRQVAITRLRTIADLLDTEVAEAVNPDA
jgi:hypothetical protein